MKRALIVVLIAVLIATVSGINDSSLAREQQAGPASDAHQREIASRVRDIEVNRVVRIERIDGTRIDAILEDVLQDAITVLVLEGTDRRRETIPFSQIDEINEVRGHKLRNILIAAGIGMAVLIGTCRASAPNLSASPVVDPR